MNNFNELNNNELLFINGGGPIRETWDDLRHVYHEAKNNFDNMIDFANGFCDGLVGK